MTDPTLISITPDMYESLILLVEDTRIQLPQELQRLIAESLEQYLPEPQGEQDNQAEPLRTQEEAPGIEDKSEDEPSSDDRPAEQTERPSTEPKAYIPHSVLLSLSQWTRLPKSSRTLHRFAIDANRYSMIALCAGTRTFTTNAQERLVKTDPTAASAFLPSNFTAPPSSSSRPTRSAPSWGNEYRAMSKELSAVFNILFSIGGVGAAVFVVAKTSSGMRQESAILLAFLGALVTAIAEVWLYIAYSRRSARRAKCGEALRLAETRQAGLSKEQPVSEAQPNEKAGPETTGAGDMGGMGEKVEGDDDGVPTASATGLTTEGKDTVQTSRAGPSTSTIRLRRKPLTRAAQ